MKFPTLFADIFKVYNYLGPGRLESAYEAALIHEIRQTELDVQFQVGLPLVYDTITVDAAYRFDLLINNKFVVEIKSVENLLNVHHKQIMTYLKLSGMKLGLPVNFNTGKIAEGIFRKVNGL